MRRLTQTIHKKSVVHNQQKPIRGSIIGQIALNGLLRIANENPSKRTVKFLFKSVLRFAAKSSRLVKFRANQVDLIIPADHPLPFRMLANPSYLNFMTCLANLIGDAFPDRAILIVGADVGVHIPFLKGTHSSDIMAIEPNPNRYRILNRNVLTIEKVTTTTEFDSISGLIQPPKLVVITQATDPLAVVPLLLAGNLPAALILEIDPLSMSVDKFIELVGYLEGQNFHSSAVFDSNGFLVSATETHSGQMIMNLHRYFSNIRTPYFLALINTANHELFRALTASMSAG